MDYFVKLVAEVGEESLMEHCCKFLLLSTTRPTSEQRSNLLAKLDQDKRYEDMRNANALEPVSPPSPLIYHEPTSMNEVVDRLATLVEAETDNWVQCEVYGCERWHKLPDTMDPKSLPTKWVCANNTWKSDNLQCAAEKPRPFVRDGKAPKAPRAAEDFWPAARAKRLVKHYYKDTKPCHMEALTMLARRKNLTMEELFRMKPHEYIDNDYLTKILFGRNYQYCGH